MQQKKMMRKKRKQQKRKRIFIFCCFIVCSIAILALVFKAPFFNISEVKVENFKLLKKDQILQKADIEIGSNIFGVSMSGVEEKIMGIPYVKSVEVKRVFPNKVRISIEECVPKAYIKHDKKYILVDAEGKILEFTKDTKKYDVATISGLKFKNPQLGTKISQESDNRIKYCVSMLEILESVKLIDKVVSLDFTHLTGIKMNYDNRVFVNCGSYENYDDFKYKLTMCNHLIKEEISPYEKVEVDLTMNETIVRPYEDPEEREKRLKEERKQREEAKKAEEEARKAKEEASEKAKEDEEAENTEESE